MTGQFDPYRTWLGIPPERQPPNHYELLGIPLFEEDPTVITHAADQRMGFLRTFQAGPHQKESQRLLNEVAAARVCLLNAKKKAAYDRKLRARLAASKTSAPHDAGAAPARKPAPRPLPLAGGSGPAAPATPGGSRAVSSAAERAGIMRIARFAAAGFALAVLVGAGVAIWRSQQPEQTADRQPMETPPSQDQTHPVPTPAEQTTPGAGEQPPAVGASTQPGGQETGQQVGPGGPASPKAPSTHPPAETSQPDAAQGGAAGASEPTRQQSGQATETTSAPGAEASQQPGAAVHAPEGTEEASGVTEQPGEQQPSGESPSSPEQQQAQSSEQTTSGPNEQPPDSVAEQEPGGAVDASGSEAGVASPPVKLPVPDQAQQAELRKRLDEIYDLDAHRTAEQRVELAQRLLRLSEATDLKPAEKFVVLRSAAELAVSAGELNWAFDRLEQMGQDFEFDVLGAKAFFFEKAAGRLLKPEALRELVDLAGQLAEQAVSARRFDLAMGVADAAYKASGDVSDRQVRKEAYELCTEMTRLKRQWEAAQRARARLEQNPDDADAHLQLGQAECFLWDNWQEGLPHLAGGSDPELAQAAKVDLATDPEDAAQCVKAADVWWALAEQPRAEHRVAFQRRAAWWYRQAIPGLEGLELVKATERLKRLEEQLASAGATLAPARQSGPHRQLHWHGRLPIRFRRRTDAAVFFLSPHVRFSPAICDGDLDLHAGKGQPALGSGRAIAHSSGRKLAQPALGSGRAIAHSSGRKLARERSVHLGQWVGVAVRVGPTRRTGRL